MSLSVMREDPPINAELTTTPRLPIDAFESLIGDRVRLVHSGADSEGRHCLKFTVKGLDPLWALRLPDGWRLCHHSRLDAIRRRWMLERAGEVIVLETLDGRCMRGGFRFPMEFALRGKVMLQHVARPRPSVVTVVGPDGSGKSTVAGELATLGQQLRLRTTHQHFSPGVLPRPGAFLRREEREWSTPHAPSPHGPVTSFVLLGYFWLDFLLGSWRGRLARAPALIVGERGWWDLAVDPRRYRLRTSTGVVRALGRLLPHPDCVLALEASAETIVARKSELPPAELTRQIQAWRDVLPKKVPRACIDASLSEQEVAHAAKKEVLGVMDERATSRLGSGWVSLARPGRGSPTPSAPHYVPRLILPRAPRAAVVAALHAYHPCSTRARFAWQTSRRFAALGGFRLLPRGAAPPRVVRELLAPHLPSRTTIAVAESDHPGRFVAVIVGDRGTCHGVAKLATDTHGQTALENEARALDSLAKFLPPPLYAPGLLAQDKGLLLLEPVQWVPRRLPWVLPPEIARAIGAFFGANGADELMGPTHGDFTPWNLLKAERGWVLVDWEEARDRDRPFFDLFHYLFMVHLNLETFSQQALLDGLEGKGWIGRAIAAYAEGAGLHDVDPRDFLIFYLHSSSERLNLATPDGRSDFRARQRLLASLER
jgi:hypothetical protein